MTVSEEPDKTAGWGCVDTGVMGVVGLEEGRDGMGWGGETAVGLC